MRAEPNENQNGGARPAASDGPTENRIALLVGGDLDDATRAEIEHRLTVCSRARACHDEMRQSLEALHACRDRAAETEREGREREPSLWPELRKRLAAGVRCASPHARLDGLRSWVPSLTVAALVLALATVATNPPIPRGGGDGGRGEWGYPPTTGVGTPPVRVTSPPNLAPFERTEPIDLEIPLQRRDTWRSFRSGPLPPGGSPSPRRTDDGRSHSGTWAPPGESMLEDGR